MARDSSNLFDLEAILPSQYAGSSGRDDGTSAERRLMLAVLRDAVDCYQRHALARDERGKALFSDAQKWIESDEREWPLSYENICETLGFDANRIRRELCRWHQARAPLERRTVRIVPLRERRHSFEDKKKNALALGVRVQRRSSAA